MEKIISMLKEIGASDELAGAIAEELKRYDEEVEAKYKAVYESKLKEAKKICVEEIENYKVQLAEKVSLFLESKAAQIEKRVSQQKAIEEGHAVSKLRSIREITEDIEVASDAEIVELKQMVEDLRKRNETLTEEKKRAEQAANRANEIALKVIRESKLAEGDEEDAPVVEEENQDEVPESLKNLPPALQKKAMEKMKKSEKKDEKEEGGEEEKEEATKEEKKAAKKTVKEEVKKRKVKAARPKTTRRTPVETQATSRVAGDPHILEIANAID